MYRLCFALMMLADLAEAATIVNATVTCDGVTTSASSCQESDIPAAFVEVSQSFPYSVGVETIVETGHSASASVSLQADVPITIISGPATGYFVPCISAESDSSLGFASASATLGPDSATSGGNRLFGDCTSISKDEFVPYKLGVTEILPLSMTASASALPSGAGGQAGAIATFDTLAIFNSAGDPISPAYTIAESPEPTAGLLVFCGAVLLCVAGRGLAQSSVKRARTTAD